MIQLEFMTRRGVAKILDPQNNVYLKCDTILNRYGDKIAEIVDNDGSWVLCGEYRDKIYYETIFLKEV